MTRRTGELSAERFLPLVEPWSSSHFILNELRDAGLKGRKVDFMYASGKFNLQTLNLVLSRYVDEVQDNLLIDTLSVFSVSFFSFQFDLDH